MTLQSDDSNSALNGNSQHRIYSVSELTAEIKNLLEERFPFLWILGEISNFRTPVSGHFYFTLKDENAQIQAVMFRGQNRSLKFVPEDGMNVTGLGRLSVYEPRGNYQIIFEYLEPKGVGALQVAFEQLKARLFDEGLFDEKHKKPLPFLPRQISLITSLTGAVVHDILNIIDRRFPNVHIEIIPVKVQGDGSEKKIVSAINLLNARRTADVTILARGGGSLEDLHAFNSEVVARAIFESEIPIISAVGHETDFTIADFVADLRAPTPSAAAELVVPLKENLTHRYEALTKTLKISFYNYIGYLKTILIETTKRLVDPKKKIQDLRLRTDDFAGRLIRRFTDSVHQKRERLFWRVDRLYANTPQVHISRVKTKLEQINNKLFIFKKIYLDKKYHQLRELTVSLDGLSPTAILDRGYSITRTVPEAEVVRDPNSVRLGQDLEVMLSKGSLFVNVRDRKLVEPENPASNKNKMTEGKQDNGQTNF
jgi:exodeoxyribonuclease VII large subunit